jgi:hypothetical protein
MFTDDDDLAADAIAEGDDLVEGDDLADSCDDFSDLLPES